MSFRLIRYGLRRKEAIDAADRRADIETKYDLGVDEDASLSKVFTSAVLRDVLEIQGSGINSVEFGRDYAKWVEQELAKKAKATRATKAALAARAPVDEVDVALSASSPRPSLSSSGSVLAPELKETMLDLTLEEKSESSEETAPVSLVPPSEKRSIEILAKMIAEEDAAFASHWSVILAAMFDFPTRNYRIYDILMGKEPSWWRNFKQNAFRMAAILAPQSQKEFGDGALSVPGLLALVWHLIKALPGVVLNVCRMLVVTLPFVLGGLAFRGLENLLNYNQKLGKPPYNNGQRALIRPFVILGIAGTAFVYGLSMLVMFLGKAVFSPFSAARDLWNLGEFVRGGAEGSVEGTYLKVPGGENKALGYFLQVMAFVSGLVTAILYSLAAIVAYPLLFGLAGATGTPAWLAGPLSSGLETFSGLASLGAVVFGKVGAVIAAGVNMVFGVAVPTAMVNIFGLSALTGIAAAGLGILARGILYLAPNFYHRFALRNLLLNDFVEPGPIGGEEEIEITPPLIPLVDEADAQAALLKGGTAAQVAGALANPVAPASSAPSILPTTPEPQPVPPVVASTSAVPSSSPASPSAEDPSKEEAAFLASIVTAHDEKEAKKREKPPVTVIPKFLRLQAALPKVSCGVALPEKNPHIAEALRSRRGVSSV